MTGAGAEIARNADGIALGGIRTPPVDVPVDVLSGAPGPSPALPRPVLGSSTPLPAPPPRPRAGPRPPPAHPLPAPRFEHAVARHAPRRALSEPRRVSTDVRGG